MIKIALIDSSYAVSREEMSEYSLGVLVIAKVVQDAGFKPLVLDSRVENGNPAAIVHELNAWHPDVVGIGTRCDSYPFAIKLARSIKRYCTPTPIVVFGGPQATDTDGATLSEVTEVDLIVRGEGEATTAELLQKIVDDGDLCEVAGLSLRVRGSPHRTMPRATIEPLDSPPAYDMLPDDYYAQRPYAARVEVGRGCPYKCTFCSTAAFWDRRFRIREVSGVARDMEWLRQRHGYTHFVLEHDNLFVHGPRARAFLGELAAATDRRYTWECSGRIDSRALVDAPELARNGLRGLYFGLESGSPRMQRVLKKGVRLEHLDSSLDRLAAASISFTASFVYGHPLEEEEDIEATLRQMVGCAVRTNCRAVQLHKLSPMANTELMEEYRSRLAFDGVVSDQVSSGYHEADATDIARDPELYSPYFSFPTPKLTPMIVARLSSGWPEYIQEFARSIYLWRTITKNDIIRLVKSIPDVGNDQGRSLWMDLSGNDRRLVHEVVKFEAAVYKLMQEGASLKGRLVLSLCIDPTADHPSSLRLQDRGWYLLERTGKQTARVVTLAREGLRQPKRSMWAAIQEENPPSEERMTGVNNGQVLSSPHSVRGDGL